MDFKLIAVVAVLALGAFCLMGCMTASPYRVDYNGMKDCYKNAKDRYPAGSTVKLVFTEIATDTDYTFLLDGQPVSTSFGNGGYEISFEMPAHDVKLVCDSRNSMTMMVPAAPAEGIQRGEFVASHARGTVATVGGDSSNTVELYTSSDPAWAWIEITDESPNPKGQMEHTCSIRLLPAAAVSDVRAVIERCQFAQWGTMPMTPPPDGSFEEVHFATADGNVCVVGPAGVPVGHEGELHQVAEAIYAYVDQFQLLP